MITWELVYSLSGVLKMLTWQVETLSEICWEVVKLLFKTLEDETGGATEMKGT